MQIGLDPRSKASTQLHVSASDRSQFPGLHVVAVCDQAHPGLPTTTSFLALARLGLRLSQGVVRQAFVCRKFPHCVEPAVRHVRWRAVAPPADPVGHFLTQYLRVNFVPKQPIMQQPLLNRAAALATCSS